MTNEEDQKALALFSTRKGSALRMVLSHKEDIARWLSEGWSVSAIYQLLKSKGAASAGYTAFLRAVNKVFDLSTVKKEEITESHTTPAQNKQSKTSQRPRPHELQRQEPKKFVTFTGVDHIGLDKKDE